MKIILRGGEVKTFRGTGLFFTVYRSEIFRNRVPDREGRLVQPWPDLPSDEARASFHFRNGRSINPSSNFEDALLHPSSNPVYTFHVILVYIAWLYSVWTAYNRTELLSLLVSTFFFFFSFSLSFLYQDTIFKDHSFSYITL